MQREAVWEVEAQQEYAQEAGRAAEQQELRGRLMALEALVQELRQQQTASASGGSTLHKPGGGSHCAATGPLRWLTAHGSELSVAQALGVGQSMPPVSSAGCVSN